MVCQALDGDHAVQEGLDGVERHPDARCDGHLDLLLDQVGLRFGLHMHRVVKVRQLAHQPGMVLQRRDTADGGVDEHHGGAEASPRQELDLFQHRQPPFIHLWGRLSICTQKGGHRRQLQAVVLLHSDVEPVHPPCVPLIQELCGDVQGRVALPADDPEAASVLPCPELRREKKWRHRHRFARTPTNISQKNANEDSMRMEFGESSASMIP